MTVDILTPDETLFSGEASYVGLPGSDGSLGIMNNHAPLVTTLKSGTVVVKNANGETTSMRNAWCGIPSFPTSKRPT